jgi:hypothetical protein
VSKTEIYIGIHSGLSIAARRRPSEWCGWVRVFLNGEREIGVFAGRHFRVV